MTVCWSLHWSDSWFPGSWRATASRVACSYGRGRRRTHRDFLPGKPAPCLRLKAHRLRAGLTQAEVAESLAALAWDHDQERLGVDANMVSKWERGITRPRKLYRRLLCSLYGATEQDLGLRSLPADTPVDGAHGDDVNRREFLRSAALMGAAVVPLGPWDRISWSIDKPKCSRGARLSGLPSGLLR